MSHTYSVKLVYEGENSKNKSGVSRKEWSAKIVEKDDLFKVLVTWGPLGSPNRAMVKEFPNLSDAEWFISSKEDEKLRKGYKIQSYSD